MCSQVLLLCTVFFWVHGAQDGVFYTTLYFSSLALWKSILIGLLSIIYFVVYNTAKTTLQQQKQLPSQQKQQQLQQQFPLPFYLFLQIIYTFITTCDINLFMYYGMHIYDYTIVQALLHPGPLLINFR